MSGRHGSAIPSSNITSLATCGALSDGVFMGTLDTRRRPGPHSRGPDRPGVIPAGPSRWLRTPRILGVVERLVIFGAVMFVLLWLASTPNSLTPLKTRTSVIPGAVGAQCPLTVGEQVAGGIPFRKIPAGESSDLPLICRVGPT